MHALFTNRYFQVIAGILVALVLGFTSGYSYKSDKVELERLQQFELIQGKLDKIRKFSDLEADRVISNMLDINHRLANIMKKVENENPILSNVPCVPSEDFSRIWMEIDNVDKKPNS